MVECVDVAMPDKFYSFSGHEATNTGDYIIFGNLRKNMILIAKFVHCDLDIKVSLNIFVIVVLVADCSWDFFRCTERYGSWPANKVSFHPLLAMLLPCCSIVQYRMSYSQFCLMVILSL